MKKAIPFLIIIILILSCREYPDYNGIYKKYSGNCKKEYIALKKVQGFSDKYYLVIVFDKNQAPEEGKEFLGVVNFDRNLIELKTGSIQVIGESILVKSRERECIYRKQ